MTYHVKNIHVIIITILFTFVVFHITGILCPRLTCTVSCYPFIHASTDRLGMFTFIYKGVMSYTSC